MRQESHFSLTKHFPVLELMFSSAPIAFIITRTDQLKIYKIKPILNQYFVCEYGWFRLRPERKLGIFKQAVYLYSGANFSSLDVQALKEIELYCKRMGRTELERYIEEKMEEQEAKDLRAMHVDHEHEVNTEKIGEFMPDEEAGEPEPEEPEEEYRAKIRLVARAAREPINHYVETFLASYCAVDPQSLRTAFKEVQATEKHLKSMSRSISTYFPIMLVFVAIFGAFLFLTNIEVITSQFEGILEP